MGESLSMFYRSVLLFVCLFFQVFSSLLVESVAVNQRADWSHTLYPPGKQQWWCAAK